MRLVITYETRFRYAAPVRESANELRACPVSDERQQLRSYRVMVDPSVRTVATTDYWGTRVDSFQIRPPHEALTIVAESTVDTSPSARMAASPRMHELHAPQFRADHLEYLESTQHTAWGDTLSAEAQRRAEAVGDDVVGVVLGMHRAVGTMLTYAPGATTIGEDVESILQRREGVCQDYAHLMIAFCRSLQIPARYVSGYFFASSDAIGEAPVEDMVTVQTHAWVEVAVPGAGWWALDPTNHQEVGERHVKIGHGRDYDDVSPLRGVFSGPAAHELEVVVEIRRQQVAQQQQ